MYYLLYKAHRNPTPGPRRVSVSWSGRFIDVEREMSLSRRANLEDSEVLTRFSLSLPTRVSPLPLIFYISNRPIVPAILSS